MLEFTRIVSHVSLLLHVQLYTKLLCHEQQHPEDHTTTISDHIFDELRNKLRFLILSAIGYCFPK